LSAPLGLYLTWGIFPHIVAITVRTNLSHPLKTSFLKPLRDGLVIAYILFLTACGGGTTAGIGGSGIGGTGITTASVNGNVVQVTASLIDPSNTGNEARMLASIVEYLNQAANAQTGGVPGIVVKGGGQQSVTDQFGRFKLPGVLPSNNFLLQLILPNGQSFGLPVGNVPAGTIVEVKNIVINTSQNEAAPAEIEVTEDPNKNTSSGSDDGSSKSEDSESQGQTEGSKFTHDPNATNCAECHAADFQQSKHLKVEEPKIYYTVSELSNCAGTCHLYKDDTFTTIKESWSNKHSIYQSDW